ncbi:MAG: acyl carrier protein [bacterium]|nr:acyl carrier protein [bacterium]
MEKTEIILKVKKIIVDLVGVEEGEILLESGFVNDLGVDSLLLSELIMNFEDTFGLSVSDEEAMGLRTVGEVVDFIYKAKAA